MRELTRALQSPAATAVSTAVGLILFLALAIWQETVFNWAVVLAWLFIFIHWGLPAARAHRGR